MSEATKPEYLKEFDKWWIKNGITANPPILEDAFGEVALMGWKAALKWVEELNKKYWYESEYLEQDIEKELEDEQSY